MSQAGSKSQQSWIGQTIAGRYKIEAMLGHGGMSTVYRATDPNLRRTVAVKLIHPHLSNDPQFVRRFEQEAAAVAQLRHPNIIQVYDFNHDNDSGIYYMVLEYVPGDTLQARLATLNAAQQRMPLAETIHITSLVCDAVAYAHQHGMIHRDLKPANVMLNPQGQPILMDFGVAKMLGESHQTAAGSVIGTALYMSPEQARGERPDERSDIYSIGVMLYEMIAGVTPFQADSAISLMMKHVTQPIPDIRQLNKTAPDLLVGVTKKALAKEPAERYRTASEMSMALRAIDLSGREATMLETVMPKGRQTSSSMAAGSPVSSVSPAVASPARKNNPVLWLLGVACVVLFVGLASGLFWLFSGSRQSSASTVETSLTVPAQNSVLPSSEGMVKISEGTYTVGRDAPGQNYVAPQQIQLADFWLDQYEVTNAQYADFLTAINHPPPGSWPEGKFPAGEEKFPVKGIGWEMADAYCRWAKKRLPTEAEWEIAARGREGRLYPWGDDQGAVKLPQSGNYAVGSKPTNQSAFGVFDMAGNVWEWVGDPYAPVPAGQQVLRGGENGFLKDMAYRLIGPPNQESIIKTAGIRCAADEVNAAQTTVAQVEGLIFQDNFVDSGSGWPILSEGNNYFGYHPPDYYHIEVGQAGAHTVVSNPPTLADVTLETKVKVDHTNTPAGNFRYGLALRRSGDLYYAFTVSSRTGAWQVVKSSSAGLKVLAEGEVDSLQGFAPPGFTPDKLDTLRVDARGADFIFHINNQPVIQVNDAEYAEGEIGFFVETFDETLAHVHYDELVARQVEFEAIPNVAVSLKPTTALTTPVATEETAAATSTPALTASVAATTEPAATLPPPSEVVAVEATATQPPVVLVEEHAEEAVVAPTPTPVATPVPTATPEPPTAAPQPQPEGMVLVPAGEFLMGSSTGSAEEQPEHPVSLDAFYLDRFEVSNAQYRACVAGGGCSPANLADSFTYPGYRDNPTYDNYPVIGVTWDQAGAYCQWAGKRLPTEAEWEYAAGGSQNFAWPWGNTFDPNLSAASAKDTQPVDSYPGGVSPFGVYNMAGNVAEWVQDGFDLNFYANSPAKNPVNTGSVDARVYRGGAFDNPDGAFYTTSRRYSRPQGFNDVDIGFRCAMNVP